MASFPRDKGPYHRVIFDHRINGKRRTKTFYFKKSEFNRSEVAAWKAEREKEFKAGSWEPWGEQGHVSRSNPLTVRRAIQEYLETARFTLAKNTFDHRKGYLHLLADYVGWEAALHEVDKKLLTEWVNNHGKYKTKMKRLEAIRALFGHYGTDPAITVYATRAEKKRAKRADKTWISSDEFHLVKAAAAQIHEYRIIRYPKHPAREFEREFPWIFQFLVNTGLRRSDLLNLSTDWFEGDFLRIGDDHYTPKSQEDSELIPLTPEARQIGERWVKKYGSGVRPFVKISPDWYTRFWKSVFKKSLPEKAARLTAHKMRDTAAMYLLFDLGLSPQTVQQITRHEDLSTLMIYTHHAPHQALREINNTLHVRYKKSPPL